LHWSWHSLHAGAYPVAHLLRDVSSRPTGAFDNSHGASAMHIIMSRTMSGIHFCKMSIASIPRMLHEHPVLHVALALNMLTMIGLTLGPTCWHGPCVSMPLIVCMSLCLPASVSHEIQILTSDNCSADGCSSGRGRACSPCHSRVTPGAVSTWHRVVAEFIWNCGRDNNNCTGLAKGSECVLTWDTMFHKNFGTGPVHPPP